MTFDKHYDASVFETTIRQVFSGLYSKSHNNNKSAYFLFAFGIECLEASLVHMTFLETACFLTKQKIWRIDCYLHGTHQQEYHIQQ